MLLVCCGGRRLFNLTCPPLAARRQTHPGCGRRPVEPEEFDEWLSSLASGVIKRTAACPARFGDAIITPQPGNHDLSDHSRPCGPGLVVDRGRGASRMVLPFSRLKLVAEPAVAVAVGSSPCFIQAENAKARRDVTISVANVDAMYFAWRWTDLADDRFPPLKADLSLTRCA